MRSLYYTMSEAYLAVISDNISRHFPVITYIKFPFGSQWSLSDSLFSISWVWGGSRCPWCWIAGCVVWRGDYLKPYWLTDWHISKQGVDLAIPACWEPGVSLCPYCCVRTDIWVIESFLLLPVAPIHKKKKKKQTLVIFSLFLWLPLYFYSATMLCQTNPLWFWSLHFVWLLKQPHILASDSCMQK